MGKNNDIIKLEGREFRRVRHGLDEKQVASFVKELVSERDELLRQHEEATSQGDTLTKKDEHPSSLMKLAERTIVEADKLAEETKREAAEEAKKESAAIIAEAREMAKQETEETKREILSAANRDAEAIRANAEREAELLLENQRQKVREEMENKVHQLYSQVSSLFENLKQQAVTSQDEVLQSLAQLVGQDSAAGTYGTPLEVQPKAIVKDGTDVTPEVAAASATNSVDGVVEVEILPPLDVNKVVQLTRYLDGLAEVKSTDLVPLADRPIIVVFLHKPIDLVEILGKHPMVDRVKEAADGESAAVTDITYVEGEPKRIQMEFSQESVQDDAK